ncbi:hypothetical protein [Sodalis sp. dw_96]|uniref:Ig-like domain-containing protein n=1 Tax=Sodalis sp. dw_96 TaxID=2719794 RepID=UPI001BD4A2AC|nr:hypothetical protein [Sodalis sp. dw_96]
MVNENSCFPGNAPDNPAPPLSSNYELSARIVADNSPANGSDLNGVIFTLYSPVNLPVANQELEFYVTGSATLLIPTPYTNNSGVLTAAASNIEPETVQLFASLAADPSVSANSILTFIPIGPLPTYELTSEILTDNAEANSSSNNEVRFYLTYGGAGVSGQLRLFITGQPTSLVTTGPDGFYTASFSSSTPGSFTVRAEVENDRAVFSAQTVTFIPGIIYPIRLGTNVITFPQAGSGMRAGMERLMSGFNIIEGHVYYFEGFPANVVNYTDCPEGSVFDNDSQSCLLNTSSDYLFSDSVFASPFRALRSGQGSNLRSRYAFWPALAQYLTFNITVYDNGPG